jgi:hypothetical protein
MLLALAVVALSVRRSCASVPVEPGAPGSTAFLHVKATAAAAQTALPDPWQER